MEVGGGFRSCGYDPSLSSRFPWMYEDRAPVSSDIRVATHRQITSSFWASVFPRRNWVTELPHLQIPFNRNHIMRFEKQPLPTNTTTATLLNLCSSAGIWRWDVRKHWPGATGDSSSPRPCPLALGPTSKPVPEDDCWHSNCRNNSSNNNDDKRL